MNATTKLPALLLLTAVLAPAGCSTNPTVTRVDPDATVDVGYRFNDADATRVFETLTADALARPWIDTWGREHGGERPIVTVRQVRNDTQDYIDTRLFTTQIERELLNSGRVRFKAVPDQRQEVRDERLDTRYNDPDTIKEIARELNADFVMVGRVGESRQRSLDNNTVVQYYQVDMELIDAETSEKVWIDTARIKKIATR